jgi:hypothetical protein
MIMHVGMAVIVMMVNHYDNRRPSFNGDGYSACEVEYYYILLHAPAELVRFRQAVRETAGVGAVAAPVGEFLPA